MGRVGRSRMIRSSRTTLAAKGAEASLGYIRPFGGWGKRENRGERKEERKECGGWGGEVRNIRYPGSGLQHSLLWGGEVRRGGREKQEGNGEQKEVMCGVWRLHLKYGNGVCRSPSLYNLRSAFSKVGCGRKVSELL